MNSKKVIAIAEQYAYAAIAAISAAVAAGKTTPKDLLVAALAGAFGPIIAALNPNEVKFGINALPPAVAEVVEEVVEESVKPAKKSK
jgi:hypothetical protein